LTLTLEFFVRLRVARNPRKYMTTWVIDRRSYRVDLIRLVAMGGFAIGSQQHAR